MAFPLKYVKERQIGSEVKWFNNELKEMRDRLSLIRDMCRVDENAELIRVRNKLRQQYRQSVRAARIRASDLYIANSDNKSKAIWKIIKTDKGNKYPKHPSNLQCEDFSVFFTNIVSKIVSDVDSNVNTVGSSDAYRVNALNIPTFSFKCISSICVRDTINSLKPSDCTDIHISMSMLKIVKECIVGPLTKLINKIIIEGKYPNLLKFAKVIPIHKGGVDDDCNNYRPISLLPVISKIIEKILFSQIVGHFSDHNLFSENQFGFRKGLSTTDAVLQLVRKITEGNERGHVTLAHFVDLTKAFDCVDHNKLLVKLSEYGFSENAEKLMASYLSDRKQSVFFKDEYSIGARVTYGVLQGSTLGPLLFLIYVNDFGRTIHSADVILFADDTTIVSSAENESAAMDNIILAECNARDWYRQNNLFINRTKTITKSFGLSKKLEKDHGSVRFLGFYMDQQMLWHGHGDHVAGRVNCATFFLRQLAGSVSREVLRTAYLSLCHTHLLYGAMVWGHADIRHRLFSLQRRALRVVSGLKYRDDCRNKFIEYKLMTLPCI